MMNASRIFEPLLLTLFVAALFVGMPVAESAERVALVVGNTDYPERSVFPDIEMAARDAKLVATALEENFGFKVILVQDASRTVMYNRLREFADLIEEGGVALFYYAGHGVEFDKTNYLTGANAEFRDKDLLGEETLNADTVINKLLGKKPSTAMIFLDCCREPPAQSWLVSDKKARNASTFGLAPIRARPGMVIGFAASAGNLANDSLGGKNGPYASALVKHMASGEELSRVLKLTGSEVNRLSLEMKKQYPGETGLVIQEPAVYDQNYRDFYFTKKVPATATSETSDRVAEMQAKLAEAERKRKALEAELAAAEAMKRTTPNPLSGTNPGGNGFPADAQTRGFTNSLGMKMVPVPETDVLFCEHETRVQDYAAYAAANSGVNTDWKDYEYEGRKQASDHPVVNVSWEDAKAFCVWLSKKEGKEYRLPTDHEWSVAVGIGAKENASASPQDKDGEIEGVYPWGKEFPPTAKVGNFHGKEGAGSFSKIEGYQDDHPFTAPVKAYQANEHGVYDLGGNVWEWCEDWYSDDQEDRVLRGGSWSLDAETNLRSSYRNFNTPTFRFSSLGFRLVVVGVGG